MRFRLFVVALIAALSLVACGQQPITAQEIVQRVEATRAATTDAHATVAIDLTTPDKSGTLVVEGWVKRIAGADDNAVPPPYKVHAVVLESSEATLVGATMVSDGTQFWFYSPNDKTVLTGSAADMADQAPSSTVGATQALQELVQQGLDAVDTELLGEEVVAGSNTWKLAVTPKADTQQRLRLDTMIKATMWVDTARAIPLKLEGDAGDLGSGKVEVRSIELNTGLSDALFTFAIPADAKVIDAAQLKPRAATLDEARTSAAFTVLTPTPPPAGAALVELRMIGSETVIQNFAGTGISFSLVQSRSELGNERQPPVGSQVAQVTVRGQAATLVTSGEPQGSMLSWEENGVRIVIAGTLTGEQATTIAETLK